MTTSRLWRVRKHDQHIDADLHETRRGVELRYAWNDRRLIALPFADEREARREAARRLRELQRAGWTSHW